MSDFDVLQKYLDGNGASPGMVEPGNIDLKNRPRVFNDDGSISTVKSMGVNINGQEVLIPQVSDDGRMMSPSEAIQMYKQTGKHLGKFRDPDSSTAYAQRLHEQQADMYGDGNQ